VCHSSAARSIYLHLDLAYHLDLAHVSVISSSPGLSKLLRATGETVGQQGKL
jgi:hypothetical protein